MLKVLQARCKLEHIIRGIDGFGAEFESDGRDLLQEAETLYAEARAIVGPEHPAWLEKVEHAAKQVEQFNRKREESEDFAPAADWTPEADRDEQAEERPAARPTLLNYAQPFTGVRLVLSDEGRQLLRPADDLFTRREYRLCLAELARVLRVLETRIESTVTGLAYVLCARCYRAHGVYDSARRCVVRAIESFQKANTVVSQKLAGQLDGLARELVVDEQRQIRLRDDVSARLVALLGKNQLADACDLCDWYLRNLKKDPGEQHWLYAGVQLLKADVLVTRAEQTCGEERRELVREVHALLRNAEEVVDGYGHDAVWVKRGARCQRERLEALSKA